MNLGKIFLGNLFPLRLERCLELHPELSELFLIHRQLLNDMVIDTLRLLPAADTNGEIHGLSVGNEHSVYGRRGPGNQTRRDGPGKDAREMGQSAWLNTNTLSGTLQGMERRMNG